VCNFEIRFGRPTISAILPCRWKMEVPRTIFYADFTMEGVQRRYAQKGILGTGTSSTLCDTRSCHKPALQIRTKGPGIMSGRTSGKEKQQSPQRCPKCGATANLTVSVTVIPDWSSVLGDRSFGTTTPRPRAGLAGLSEKLRISSRRIRTARRTRRRWKIGLRACTASY
jgi:hypothetical protein